MNRKALFRILLIASCLVLAACATTETVDTAAGESSGPVIQYIDIFDNQVRIQADGPFEYTLYKPGDPFKVIVELPGVNPGAFQDRIVSEKEGITEITPVVVTEPSLSTRLEILLQNPGRLVPEMSGNLLILNLEAGETVEVAETEVEQIESLEKEEPLQETGQPAEIATEVPVEETAAAEVPVEEPAAETTVEGETAEETVTTGAGDEGLAAAGETPVEPSVQEEESVVAGAETEAVPSVEGPEEARNITAIKFERIEDAVKVIIEADGEVRPDVLPLEGRLVLDFIGVDMKARMPKEVAYPLRGIRWGRHDGKTRVVLDLMQKASYDVIAINDSVVVSLSAPDMIVPVAKGEAGPEAKEEAAAAKKSPVEAAVEAATERVIEEGKYKGKRISLDFQDADIVPIFRLFADVSGYNFVISPKVKGKITMKLINVPWDQALDLVLRTHNLGKQIEGNIIRIAPNADLAKESEAKAKAKAALARAKPLSTRIFTINYAGVDRISEAINKAKLLSARGSMTIDERASVIIINDVDDTFPKVKNLIEQLDKPDLQVRQVMIEARIVEASTTFAKDLGIQWGAWGRTNDYQLIGGGSALTGGTGMTGNNFIVNMPAGVQQGTGAAIGLGYLNAARTLALDLQLSALERTGEGKIISNPRIITMNNTPAKITQGRTIYVPVATSDKTDVKAIDANLTLDVTPSIAPGGAILLKLKISKDEPGDIVAGNISINRNNAETTTLINSGDTVVIGGIYKKRVLSSDDGVPWLSKIPILGWLFRHKRVDEDTSEVLIFITPKVVQYELPKNKKDM